MPLFLAHKVAFQEFQDTLFYSTISVIWLDHRQSQLWAPIRMVHARVAPPAHTTINVDQ